MTGLLDARRRYAALHASLEAESPIDRDLRAELTETIRCLDRKIAGACICEALSSAAVLSEAG